MIGVDRPSLVEILFAQVLINLVATPRHRGVRAMAGRRAFARDPRLDSRRTRCRGVLGQSGARLHRKPEHLVPGLVLRAAPTANWCVALVEAREYFLGMTAVCL